MWLTERHFFRLPRTPSSPCDAGGTLAAAIDVAAILSLYGAYLSGVHLTSCISPFFLSSTYSGISEMLRLSVELLSVTNTLLAEKAKYQ